MYKLLREKSMRKIIQIMQGDLLYGLSDDGILFFLDPPDGTPGRKGNWEEVPTCPVMTDKEWAEQDDDTDITIKRA